MLVELPQIQAQSYRLAGGARFGTEAGLTAKYRITHRGTLEAILQQSIYQPQSMATLLYEQHSPIIGRRFNFYGGAGLHTGLERSDAYSGGLFGITLIGGAEMTIGRVNVSYDFKPAINLSGGETVFMAQTAVSVRYVFIRNPKRPFIGRKQDRYRRGEEPVIKLPRWWPERGN